MLNIRINMMKMQAQIEVKVKKGAVEATGEDASETYTDIDGIEGVSEVEDDILYWFFLTCTSMLKQITELMKRFSEFKKDLRIMKKTLEDIKAKEKTSEPQPEKPTPPEIKTQDSCHSKPRETNSEKETNLVFLEKNIIFRTENRELKERLIIMERVIDQILRDQEDKRSQHKRILVELTLQVTALILALEKVCL